ncbi:hypothetical protein AURDEDRAFT_159953 [Auricularia subglabra TFB-10046 SS5]|nr:hypothetical protein AURDEDRAFT_159953 [Auricularia subglabra TFB-10046 SS5]
MLPIALLVFLGVLSVLLTGLCIFVLIHSRRLDAALARTRLRMTFADDSYAELRSVVGQEEGVQPHAAAAAEPPLPHPPPAYRPRGRFHEVPPTYDPSSRV